MSHHFELPDDSDETFCSAAIPPSVWIRQGGLGQGSCHGGGHFQTPPRPQGLGHSEADWRGARRVTSRSHRQLQWTHEVGCIVLYWVVVLFVLNGCIVFIIVTWSIVFVLCCNSFCYLYNYVSLVFVLIYNYLLIILHGFNSKQMN